MKVTILVSLLVSAAAVAADYPMVVGRKTATIAKGGTVVTVDTREVTTSALRVGLQCDRGGNVRQLAVGDGEGGWVKWSGKGTGRYAAPEEEPVTVRQVRVTASPVGAFVKQSQCTVVLYDANDKSYEKDGYAPGQINFVTIANSNELAIRDCLQREMGRAIEAQGLSGDVKVWLPAHQSSAEPSALGFSVDVTEPFGGKAKRFSLVLLTAGGSRWLYSSSSVSVGGVTMTQYKYETQSMNRLGYVLATDGSGQPLFRMEAGRCWGN